MYRSKLQELCQQNKWALPKYSCMRDGADHNPQFKASVIVNGINFDTETICKSSKGAYNEAAKLAFLHFTSGHNQASDQEEEAVQSPKVLHSHTSDTKHEPPHGYKMKLQIYAQRKNLGLPSYHCEREGPPHALCFKAIVTVAGESFESPEVYKNIKDAEAAAAQAALLSLTTDAFLGNSKDNLHKNLLQELIQKEGLALPTYKTTRFGNSRDLKFISTVEVEGETFSGEAATSKKQAELNAAVVAYTGLMERKGLNINCSPQEVITHSLPLYSAQASDNKKTDAFLAPPCFSPELPDLSTLSISDTSMKNTAQINSYMLCDKVRVYTCIPDALPKGTVLLPIADNKWVAASLEFTG